MASKQRIDQLTQFCEQWQESIDAAEKHRDDLIKQQSEGLIVFTSDAEGDLMPTLIKEADHAVRIYKQCLTKLEAVRDRAVAGEDV